MKKESYEMTQSQHEELRQLENLPDERIDTVDIPELIDWSDAKRGVFYRPVKQQITLRLDKDILAWFKAHAPGGRGYQTEINQALRDHIQRHKTEAIDSSDQKDQLSTSA